MVQDGFYEGFQVIRVCLGADESAIQPHIDCLKSVWTRLLANPMTSAANRFGIVVFLDCQFHFKVTFFQIDEIFLWVYLEGDGLIPTLNG